MNSTNAKALVQYLADFEATNSTHLPVIRTTTQLGWQRDYDCFLWGRTALLADGTRLTTDLDEVLRAGTTSPAIVFRGADAGDEQLARGFSERGSFADWIEGLGRTRPYPRVRLAVIAGLAAPLLKVIDCPNFGVDVCGQTSGGKTTTLRMAASVWGNPDERSPTAAMSTWDSTRVWIERAAAVVNNLPVILDDTKKVKHTKDLAQVLYDMASGRARGRGTQRGLQWSSTWSTVLISSGESPATASTTDGGTKARVLTIFGSPFDGADEETAKLVNELNQVVLRNYGHAGPAFVEFLLKRKARWPAWRRSYMRVVGAYMRRAGANPVMGRLAKYLACLTVCVVLARRANVLPAGYRNPIPDLWDDLAQETAEADVALQALGYAVGWAQTHQEEFYGRRPIDKGQPAGGWAGRWDAPDRRPRYDFLAFAPGRLTAVLAEGGYTYAEIVRAWKERGWLVVNHKEGQPKYQIVIKDERAWMIAISAAALRLVEQPVVDDFEQERQAVSSCVTSLQTIPGLHRWSRGELKTQLGGFIDRLQAARPADEEQAPEETGNIYPHSPATLQGCITEQLRKEVLAAGVALTGTDHTGAESEM